LLAFAQRGKRNCIFATHTLAKVSCKVPFTSKSAFVEKTVERLTAISMPVVLLACLRVQIYKLKMNCVQKRGDLWLNLRLFKIKRGYLC
jgi:hypothetical protein